MAKKADRAKEKAWEAEYVPAASLASMLCDQLDGQLGRLFIENDITLGFPVQLRVKTWESIRQKLSSLPQGVKQLADLQDLAGLRVVLQFSRDIEKVCTLIEGTLDVIRRYNTLERLRDDQFGYSSVHFVVQLPKNWLRVPTMTALGGLRAEIQVRTLAQHIWASASHTLQYKSEASVPPTLRRSIYRVSALLETVDLELERLLVERAEYRTEIATKSPASAETLNVDLLASVLDEILPVENRAEDEDYGNLLRELRDAGIQDVNALRELWAKYRFGVMKKEATHLKITREEYEEKGTTSGTTEPRLLRGVYFTHTGLVRVTLTEASKRSKRPRPR